MTLHQKPSLAHTAVVGKPRAEGQSRLTRLRESHHHVAKLLARGLRRSEVAVLSGYTPARISNLQADPMFQELMVSYRNDTDTQVLIYRPIDQVAENAAKLALRAQRHLLQRFEQADEDGETLSVREALPIASDALDRLGYTRKSTQVNLNADFASLLDAAIRRSDEVLGRQQAIDSGALAPPSAGAAWADGTSGPEVEPSPQAPSGSPLSAMAEFAKAVMAPGTATTPAHLEDARGPSECGPSPPPWADDKPDDSLYVEQGVQSPGGVRSRSDASRCSPSASHPSSPRDALSDGSSDSTQSTLEGGTRPDLFEDLP